MKKVLLRICLGLGIFVLFLSAILLMNTQRFMSKQMNVEPAPEIRINTEIAAKHLAHAVQYRTISFPDPEEFNKVEFLNFHQYLEKIFPNVHSSLEKEVIGGLSLLYTWRGQQQELKPILLMAHMDVVPVEPGTEADWTHPPFHGNMEDGYVWGRGTLDDKGSLLAVLEAVEWLLEKEFQPQRTIYLAFGHDEEMLGKNGALQISKLLQSRNVELEYTLDEGQAIAEGMTPGLSNPLAIVGIAEKGFLCVELIVEQEGGHPLVPGEHTTIGTLSRAIHRLEENPMSARLEAPVKQMIDYIGPELPFLIRIFSANQWLFAGMTKRNLSSTALGNAMIQTLPATTVFHAGEKPNLMPKSARAVVVFGIITGDSTDGVIEHVRRTINDPMVKIRPLEGLGGGEPSRVSGVDSPNFKLLQRTIHQVFPEVIIAPGLMIAVSDSRHYERLSRDSYRFVPYRFVAEDLSRLHGTNERISITNYGEIIKFYIQVIRNSSESIS